MEYRAFDLHPGVPLEGEPLPERYRQGGSRSAFTQLADEAGLPYGPRTHRYNSTPAHQATEWAAEQGRGDEFRWAVYRAYFVENANIGSPDVLAGLADRLGLDGQGLRAALADRRYRGRVLQQFEDARSIGVTAVPTFVADDTYALIGAHPYEHFRKLMEAVGAQLRPAAGG